LLANIANLSIPLNVKRQTINASTMFSHRALRRHGRSG